MLNQREDVVKHMTFNVDKTINNIAIRYYNTLLWLHPPILRCDHHTLTYFLFSIGVIPIIWSRNLRNSAP